MKQGNRDPTTVKKCGRCGHWMYSHNHRGKHECRKKHCKCKSYISEEKWAEQNKPLTKEEQAKAAKEQAMKMQQQHQQSPMVKLQELEKKISGIGLMITPMYKWMKEQWEKEGKDVNPINGSIQDKKIVEVAIEAQNMFNEWNPKGVGLYGIQNDHGGVMYYLDKKSDDESSSGDYFIQSVGIDESGELVFHEMKIEELLEIVDEKNKENVQVSIDTIIDRLEVEKELKVELENTEKDPKVEKDSINSTGILKKPEKESTEKDSET